SLSADKDGTLGADKEGEKEKRKIRLFHFYQPVSNTSMRLRRIGALAEYPSRAGSPVAHVQCIHDDYFEMFGAGLRGRHRSNDRSRGLRARGQTPAESAARRFHPRSLVVCAFLRPELDRCLNMSTRELRIRGL